MTFTFLRATGAVAFFRSDAEQAEWSEEQFSLLCSFPYLPEKTIERGMRVLFQDPATNAWQAYEIRNCTLFPGEAYQQFTAEDIAISELTDCHLPGDIEMDQITVSSALSQILSGTGWSIGTVSANPASSADIGRGSVWEGVNTIRSNWNVYILPRVTVNASGIVGRYLDVLPPEGVFRGLRIAVDKNVSDPCVTYDDSGLYTALYGYGKSYSVGDTPETSQTLETTFASVVWGATSSHPAKPAGQKYLEDPAKTALFGRNGKPRFGYYQNTEIDDPQILLDKTWETLKTVSTPKISVTGTVADLKRLGYNDVPLRIYDMAIIDLGSIQIYKQVICLSVDLLDPSKNRPTIGDYIPNIIYINRDTEDYATGGGKGVSSRGGGKGGTRSKKKEGEFQTTIQQNERNILLEARQVNTQGDILNQAGMYIDPITGVLIYAENTPNNVGSKFRVQANQITAEVNARKESDNALSSRIIQNANSISLEVSERQSAVSGLSGRITVEAGRINQIVSAVGSDGKVTAASICLAINNGGSSATIRADKIYLLGQTIANTVTADYIATKISSISSLLAHAITADSVSAGSLYLHGTMGNLNVATAYNGSTLTQSGNTYTLTLAKMNGDFDQYSFSRAVSSWGVGGGSGKVNVTAYPQNQTKSVNVSIDGPSNIYSNGSYTFVVDYENLDGDDVSTGYEKTVHVSVSTPTPSNARVSSSSSGSSIGTLSGASPGKYILFNVGSSVYNIFLV